MAQVDTGLGWSAKDTYVVNNPISLGSLSLIGGPQFAGQPLPVVENSDQVPSAGMLIGETTGNGNRYYAAANFSGALICCFTFQTTFLKYLYIATSNVSSNRIWVVTVNRSGSIISTSSSYPSTLDSGSGLYYRTGSATSQSTYGDVKYVTQFADLSSALSSVTVTDTPIYKLNSGFAVACFVNWKDTVQTKWTPVLISTVESATKLSIDGSIEYYGAYTSIQRYNGMTFYMTYIRSINGSPVTTLPVIDVSPVIISLQELFRGIAGPSYANILVDETGDPYDPFGNTGEGGGDGDFDNTDDEIPMSTLPSLSFASTGFCRVYSPTLSQLSDLASYMWTDQTFLQTLANHIIQLLEDPMQAIISLSLVPCPVSVGTAESVKVLFIPIPDVSMAPVLNQFVDVDCGTLNVSGYYGSALDYNPYTKISCFLPFIGMVELDTDEVMGKTIGITYRIDVVSGACTATIKADGSVYYQFSGHCSVQMPVTSADFSGYVSAIMSTAKLVAGLGASAAGAPALGGALLGAPPIGSKSTTQTTTSGGEVTLTTRNPETGRQITAGRVTTGPQTKETVHIPGGMNFGELAIRSVSNTVGAVMNSKAGIQHSGGFSGISGYLGVRYPYLIIKRPRLCNPNQYGQYNGRPSMIYVNLGSCVGYTEVQSIQLTGIPATNPEMSEIAELLKSGVIM